MTSLLTINNSADFWFYNIGVNVIPANTREKKISENWSKWQDQSIPVDVHESYKKSGYYTNGIAVITGRIWRGPYEGKYLVAIDLDNKKAVEEFCRNNLERMKQQTLVEQTSNTEKMHIYFIVERAIPNKASDKTNIDIIKKINANEIPALEVKSNSKGIMFCSSSQHQKYGIYQIKGTLKPQVFEAWGIQEQISIICDKYNISYGLSSNSEDNNNNNNNNYSYLGPSIKELFTPGTKILEGHNRHLGILRVMDSLLIKNIGILSLEQMKKLTYERNRELCFPPLNDRDMERQWQQALDYAEKKIKEREEAKNKQKEKKRKQQHYQQDWVEGKEEEENKSQYNNTTTVKVEKQQLIEEGTQLVMSKHRFLTIEETKEILFYDDDSGVYYYGGEIVIEKDLENIFGFKIRSVDIAEIKGHIMRKTYVKRQEFDSNLYIINLKNGLYNLRTGKLDPHTPDYYSLNQKPIVYNPKVRAKYFIKFLKEVLWPEDILTAIDLIAYTFLRSNPHEIYFILIGTGANGKSVFTGLVTNLHGLKNVSNVPLKSLLNNRFALADLENKDVNIDTELSNATINDMSILKRLSGKQPVRIERKGKDAYDAVLHAKQIFNANQLPTNLDNSDAHYRREIPISFPNQFEGEREDPDLLDKLSYEEEMSGIFNIIVHVLMTRLIKTQRVYINQKTIKERRKKAELIRDPVTSFLKDAVSKDSGTSDLVTIQDLYLAYSRFCKYHKLPMQQKDVFGEILKKNPYNYQKERKMIEGKKKTVWIGIQLIKWSNNYNPLQQTLSSTITTVVGEEQGENE